MLFAAEVNTYTWGIPGPTFLIIFGAALVGVAVLASIHRRILFSGSRGAQVDRLGPQQIAYLNGGDQLAVYAALGGLRGAGAIASNTDKTLYQSGPLPAGVTPLDSAVYNAAGRRIRSRELSSDQWVMSALQQLRDGLESQGLAVPASRIKIAKLWALAGAFLLLVGVARLVDGLQNDRPVTFLVFALVIALILTISLYRKTRRATHAADKGMTALRRQHDYLSPGHSPSYATYGATGAAMGVALFGAASLYTMDPAFAADAEIQRINASGGTSGYDSGSSSSSCSSSSSSCSGGSSCGGGGGCGG
jgi:uncharacterized protein (TIGR04222 family)